MLSHYPSRQALTWVIAGAVLLAFPAFAADDGAPTPGGTISEEGPDASPRLDVTAVSPVAKPLPRVAPQLRRLEGVPGDKGSLFTDGGYGELSASTTALERVKLERARMAIEASRASGMLFSMRRPEVAPPFSPEDREMAKMRALEAMGRETRIPAGDPIMLPGAPLRPLQLRGPDGLTEFERRKLDAHRGGIEITAPAPRQPAPEEARPVIDAGRKDGKEGQ